MPALEKNAPGTKFSIVPGATTINRHNLLKDGTTAIAQYTALDALFALKGIEDFKDIGPQSIRTLYINGGIDQGIATRADTGIMTLQDLRGKRVATYPNYPVVQAYMDAAMAFAGISWSEVKQIPISSYAAGQTAILEGAVDAAVLSGESAAAQDIAASVRGLRWLEMPASDIEGWKRLQAVIPVFYPNKATSSAGSSPSKPVQIWAYNFHFLQYDYQDAGQAYWVTKLMWEAYPDFKDSHAYNAKTSPEHTLEVSQWFVPWHEGSIKYFKDIGVWTPAMEARQQEMLKTYPQTNTK